MTKWYAHVANMAKHTNMVGGSGPRTLGPPSKSGADAITQDYNRKFGAVEFQMRGDYISKKRFCLQQSKT